MDTRHPVIERLAHGQCIVLDGGITNELEKKGYRPGGVLQDAVAAREAPDVLRAVHRAYADAGVDVLSAHTARTTVRALARGGVGMRAAALTHGAVDLALEVAASADRPIAVAGTMGPLEGRESTHHPSPRMLADEHSEQAVRLASTGCHVILVEPMPTIFETLAATSAGRAAMRTVWTVLALRKRGEASDGTSLEHAARSIAASGAQALLLECDTPDELVPALTAVSGLALGIVLGVRVSAHATSPERMSADVTSAVQRAARLLGGTRRATVDDVRAIGKRVRARAAAA